MKRLLVITCLLISIASCKKAIVDTTNLTDDLSTISDFLKETLTASEFQQLDFNKTYVSKYKESNGDYVRVFYKGNNLQFVLLSKDNKGNILEGKIISIKKHSDTVNHPVYDFNGEISISALDRKPILVSEISNGYIMAFHKQPNILSSVQLNQGVATEPAKVGMLPECVVVAYISSNSLTYTSYINLYSISGGSGSSLTGSYSSTSGGGSSTKRSVQSDTVLELEYDAVADQPAANIMKLFNCFNKIKSNGATYSIKLCSDIPVNTSPNYLTNAPSGSSVGHSFIIIKKTNGLSSVTQAFGLYPTRYPSLFFPLSNIPSVIKVNSNSEINASIERNMTEADFNLVRENAIEWSTQPYNLANYNCSDYAIGLFNLVSKSPLTVSGIPVVMGVTDPYNAYNTGTEATIRSSPQMLFVKLQEMKNAGGPESANIIIDRSHNYTAPISHGECN